MLIARLTLTALGGDLGAGFFEGGRVAIAAGPGVLGAFVLLGALVSVAGAWAPARAAAAVAPARALKAGDAEEGTAARGRVPLALLCAAAGVGLALGPPVRGLPLFGYAAIALLLFAAVLLVPAFARFVLARLSARRPVPRLALAQLNGTVAQSAVSLAAIVVSFSLMVAMAIMVHSFRDSFERWLGEVLPADLYLRVAPGSDTAYLSPAEAGALGALPGVARLELRRTTQLSLAPDQPPVTLIARPLGGASAPLPLVARAARFDPALPPVYASEAMRDLYGYAPGQVVELPIAGRRQRFFVAGIWRDYARSTGALAVERAAFEALAGEVRYTEGSVWLEPRADGAAVAARIRALLATGDALQLVEAGALKRRSLAAFDRAFAITYALEAIAVAIGLLGVGLAFAMQALARRAEFGMLRHLGLRRGEVLAMLSGEGALLGALGALYGLLVGVALSLVLVFVVNRQSFHWSLEYVVPAGQLARRRRRARDRGGADGASHRAGRDRRCGRARRAGGLVSMGSARLPRRARRRRGRDRSGGGRLPGRDAGGAGPAPGRCRGASGISHRVVVRDRLARDRPRRGSRLPGDVLPHAPDAGDGESQRLRAAPGADRARRAQRPRARATVARPAHPARRASGSPRRPLAAPMCTCATGRSPRSTAASRRSCTARSLALGSRSSRRRRRC